MKHYNLTSTFKFYMLFAILCLLIISCNKEKDYNVKIVFSTSFYSDPSKPRIGIELQNETTYFCIEKLHSLGNYNYFYCEQQNNENLINLIIQNFPPKIETEEIVDATLCQINVYKGNKEYISQFYLETLSLDKYKIIEEVIDKKNCKSISIKNYKFPSDLLEYKLPTPPDIEDL